MSLIHPQIRSLRAEAEALDSEIADLKLAAPADNEMLCRGLSAMARAKRTAADLLHKEEMDLLERLTSTAI